MLHLTKYTIWECDKTQEKKISLFPAGDNKVAIYRQDKMAKKDQKRKCRLGMVM